MGTNTQSPHLYKYVFYLPGDPRRWRHVQLPQGVQVARDRAMVLRASKTLGERNVLLPFNTKFISTPGIVFLSKTLGGPCRKFPILGTSSYKVLIRRLVVEAIAAPEQLTTDEQGNTAIYFGPARTIVLRGECQCTMPPQDHEDTFLFVQYGGGWAEHHFAPLTCVLERFNIDEPSKWLEYLGIMRVYYDPRIGATEFHKEVK